jgi:hypothetical protein
MQGPNSDSGDPQCRPLPRNPGRADRSGPSRPVLVLARRCVLRDIHLVDNKGQLNVFWVNNAGAWGGPQGIGPTGFAPEGAAVAASQQFGAVNQTDVFVVDQAGQLNVFWVNNAGAWGGPQAIGPASF